MQLLPNQKPNEKRVERHGLFLKIISNTDENFLNLQSDKARKTHDDKQLNSITFYRTNFKPKLFTAGVKCNMRL